jgi:hypothetical protein
LKTETKSSSATGRSTKRPSTLNDISIGTIWSSSGSQKKIGHELVFFVLFVFLVAILLVLGGSVILVESTEV